MGYIAPHSHGRNYVTAILGLDVTAPCKIRAGKRIKDFKEGEPPRFILWRPHKTRVF